MSANGHDEFKRFHLDVTGYSMNEKQFVDLASFSFIKNADEVVFFNNDNPSLQLPMAGFRGLEQDEDMVMFSEYDQEGLWDNEAILKGESGVEI